MNFKAILKRKLPATFNAVEYETDRLLRRIQELEDLLSSAERKNMEAWQQLVGLMETSRKREEALSSMLRESLGDQAEMLKRLEQTESALQKKADANQEQIDRMAGDLREKIEEGNLFSIIECKWDVDFKRYLLPLNRFFQGHGMALFMHLTSVEKTLDDIVYDSPDLVRNSALALMADEIYDRKIDGAVAELGVAQGEFARVINAHFPDRKLYLFDTFEGFPETDVEHETFHQYSTTSKDQYADISLEQVIGSMRFPENCIIKKGYFPDTAEGLEESFCFVNIDCDLYKPIYAGLSYFYPRLVRGGYMFVHDYRSKYFLGVREALRAFAYEQGISYCVLPDNTGTAVIVKQGSGDEG